MSNEDDEECDHIEWELEEEHDENWMTGEIIVTEKWVERMTYVDVDIHRYKCTQCNKIFNYSCNQYD